MRKIFILLFGIFISLAIFFSAKNEANAECNRADTPPIPVTASVNQGKVTVVIHWSQMDFDEYEASLYYAEFMDIKVFALKDGNIPESIFNRGNNDPHDRRIDNGKLVDKTYNFQFTSAATLGTYNIRLVFDSNEWYDISDNHVTFNGPAGCKTFEKNPPARFTIESTGNPGLDIGDQCTQGSDELPVGDPQRCPSGSFCRSPDGLHSGNSFRCTLPLEAGATCIPNNADAPQCDTDLFCDSNTAKCKGLYSPDEGDIFKNAITPTPVCPIVGGKRECETGLGIPFPTNTGGFINTLLGVVLSLSGGIAVILIIISGHRLMISRGNPEQVQAAREQLTAAIVGLLFVIFSLVILTVISSDILNLPGFEE